MPVAAVIAAAALVPPAVCAGGPVRVPPALAGADLPDVTGPAAFRGGVAFAAIGTGARGTLSVMGARGVRARVLAPLDAGPGAGAWVWDGRDARGTALRAGAWSVGLDAVPGARLARIAPAPGPAGAAPRVTFTIGAVGGR
jgi:hypothetical protein